MELPVHPLLGNQESGNYKLQVATIDNSISYMGVYFVTAYSTCTKENKLIP